MAPRRLVAGLAGGLLGVGLLGACSSEEARLVVGGRAVADDGPHSPNRPFGIGDMIEIGDFRLVVHGLTDPFVGGSTESTASPDDRWVAVDLELFNLADEAVEVSGYALFEVQDQTNHPYRAVDPEDDTPSIDGTIPAGESRRGTVVFEVPRETTELRLFFAGDVFSRGSATVVLS